MAPHDPGRLHYRIHNVYLNFLETYERLPPGKPITIHQKALLLFWISCVLTTLVLKLRLLLKHVFKTPNISPALSEREKPPRELQSDARGQDHVMTRNLVPCRVTSDQLTRDLVQSSSNCRLNETSASLTDIKVNATARQAKDVESKLAFGIRKFEEQYPRIGNLKIFKETEPRKDDPDTDKALTALLRPSNIARYVKELLTSFDKQQPSFEAFISRMCIFGCIMFYFWLSDHLHIWPKVEKQYSRDMFVFLFSLLLFVAAIFTIRSTKDKLLNRDQTEEWKGWMQVQFVWYHYFDAQEVFNSIRVYVGAYVWMTGFGNYLYFSASQDYSIFRLLKMLFRLNFLVFCVMAVTSHEFVRYYICAMHTYWFLSVWAVMVAFNRYNKYPKFIALKFAVYFLVNALIFEIPGVVHKLFIPLRFLLDVGGKLDYWQYRSWLDHWSTLVGMIAAFFYPCFESFLQYLDKDEPRTRLKRTVLRYTITFALLGVLLLWFNLVLIEEKTRYMHLHPYTSPIPIVIYTWLRNMHPFLRTHYLNLFSWLGKITLETYLSQIHIYMMGDAKKILVYLPQYPMLNFALATLIYISVSYSLFHLTVFFSSYIFPRNIQVVTRNLIAGFIWIGSCYLIAYELTKNQVWRSDRSGLEFLRWNVTAY